MDFKAYIRPGRGAADITPLLRDGAAFRALIDAFVARFTGVPVDAVACIEGRGFLLGSPLADRLGVGLIPVRHAARLKAAEPVHTVAYVDYSRTEKVIAIHGDAIAPGDRILLVDDWVETAATIHAAIGLIERSGGVVVGVGALMDDTTPAVRATLAPYNYRAVTRSSEGDAF